jgi:hypothetical protein
MSASSPTQTTMDRPVGLSKIIRWAGLLLAGALYMVDPLELFSYSAAPISFVAADSFVKKRGGRGDRGSQDFHHKR